MSLENAMASGYSPERIPVAEYVCPRCQAGLEADTPMYYWNESKEEVWLCGDCYKDAILSMPQNALAGMSGESIAYTMQQLELVNYEPSAMADILYTDTMTAEDVL